MADHPSKQVNDAEREAQIDEIIKRAERLELEAPRTRPTAEQSVDIKEHPQN